MSVLAKISSYISAFARLLGICAITSALLAEGCSPSGEVTLCVNPLTYTDIPDNDLIRVGDDYYMVSTTMFFCPCVPVMHSKDLVHWRIVNYLCETIEDDGIYNMQDGRNAYGQGQWATSIRYNDGMFYVLFCSNDQQKSYVYTSEDIYGKWQKHTLDRHFHDSSLLFDDGRVFLVWGNGDLQITELEPDLSAVRKGGVDQQLLEAPADGYMLRAEGSHFYHIGDWYYVLEIDWPEDGIRTETCWRSRSLLGPYESKVILAGCLDGRPDGVAQGGIVDTQKGDWYAIMFQDHGAVGRIPTLQPVSWVDGWPILGDNTLPVEEFYVNLPESGDNYVYADDDFDYKADQLQLVWQWNHKPDSSGWSVTERPGWLRLKGVHTADGVMDARNTLTQRTVGPECSTAVLMDASGLEAGDHAGICAFQSNYCRIGVTVKDDGSKWLEAVTRNPSEKSAGIWVKDSRLAEAEESVAYSAPLESELVYLKLHYAFSQDKAYMSYSYDGERWTGIPVEFQMLYTLDLFTGYRTAIYFYPTISAGGVADFDWYKVVTYASHSRK